MRNVVSHQDRAQCAVLGSGNIGTDLVMKLLRSERLEPAALVGIDPDSEGLRRAANLGITTTAAGIGWLLEHAERFDLVFDATSAAAHRAHAPQLRSAGLPVIDLTPAKQAPGVVPAVNLAMHRDAPEVSLVTCGGQATIPIVAAVTRICEVPYAEIVATIASLSAGPGTRQSIDEFTKTTSDAITEIGRAEQGKAIIVLNPADPPLMMRNTVYCELPDDAVKSELLDSVQAMAQEVRRYVPGYRLPVAPVIERDRITVFVEVEGAGDYLPRYAGNLDIMTAAAIQVAEQLTANNGRPL